ncbi:epoxyqueuosine reductase [Archaeoglobus sp.]
MLADNVRSWIKRFVKGRFWREPLVSFCSADATERLSKIVPNHLTAEDLLPKAKSVVVYFIPFTEKVVKSNIFGVKPSNLWALAYVETNKLIECLNHFLAKKLEVEGFESAVIKPTHNFDEKTLLSMWSHKHVAYIAGLGTFGVHTMIITEKGCCGRLGSLVTTAEFEYNEPLKEEFCLYKRSQSCLECVKRCPFGALESVGLDKRRCYEILMENTKLFDFGFADVCGKCACGVPCSLKKP